MIDGLLQQCKHQREAFANSRVVLLTQPNYQHTDFLLVGWMIRQLNAGKKITFLAFRENYAHYTALSKKAGKSLEGFVKNSTLTYYECFESPFCSELPLVETQPSTYTPPPSLAHKVHPSKLKNQKGLFQGADWVVVDSIGYIEDTIELCYWIYEQAMLSGCRLLLGGCDQDSQLTVLLRGQAGVVMELGNDVGGFGKIRVNNETVLWRSVKGQIEFSQQIVI